jgi:hypothetical protein
MDGKLIRKMACTDHKRTILQIADMVNALIIY